MEMVRKVRMKGFNALEVSENKTDGRPNNGARDIRRRGMWKRGRVEGAGRGGRIDYWARLIDRGPNGGQKRDNGLHQYGLRVNEAQAMEDHWPKQAYELEGPNLLKGCNGQQPNRPEGGLRRIRAHFEKVMGWARDPFEGPNLDPDESR
ncbi:hypothetical protein F0562_014021 [Nyssa sinensis]|uniref:Uncharacterized protein n=1 Tax=Nyssa sinensis TaxID=561372 RepID=A0A5J4ZMB0_9ASTE|nr:hypothetical protein F0562_014021 [Nyssa sinensis]